MPISNELTERNFVTKIARYHRVVDVPNSMTVLTDMLPLSLAMSTAGVCCSPSLALAALVFVDGACCAPRRG